MTYNPRLASPHLSLEGLGFVRSTIEKAYLSDPSNKCNSVFKEFDIVFSEVERLEGSLSTECYRWAITNLLNWCEKIEKE